MTAMGYPSFRVGLLLNKKGMRETNVQPPLPSGSDNISGCILESGINRKTLEVSQINVYGKGSSALILIPVLKNKSFNTNHIRAWRWISLKEAHSPLHKRLELNLHRNKYSQVYRMQL